MHYPPGLVKEIMSNGETEGRLATLLLPSVAPCQPTPIPPAVPAHSS